MLVVDNIPRGNISVLISRECSHGPLWQKTISSSVKCKTQCTRVNRNLPASSMISTIRRQRALSRDVLQTSKLQPQRASAIVSRLTKVSRPPGFLSFQGPKSTVLVPYHSPSASSTPAVCLTTVNFPSGMANPQRTPGTATQSLPGKS